MTPKDKLRFWSKVDKNTTTGCWLWLGHIDPHGYGRFNLRGKIEKAHQLSALLSLGPKPTIDDFHGACVCHKCDVKHSVNPEHLFYASQRDNLKDMYSKNRNNQPKGIHAAKSKLSIDQVKDIRRLYATGNFTSRALGKLYHITHSAVQNIVAHKTYKEI